MPRIAPSDSTTIALAAQRLRAGGVVAMPTETVYGLAADTFNPAALILLYTLKGRPADNPLIAHVLDTDQAQRLSIGWDARCQALTERFWPGPLTIVTAKAAAVPSQAVAGRSTIALRSPAHPIARLILQEFGSPLSAPSANRSGHVSPTRAEHVFDDFSRARQQEADPQLQTILDELLIIDAGPSVLGIESTVIDLSNRKPRLLRPGSITIEQLRQVLGDIDTERINSQGASPGTAARHYSPRTPCELVEPAHLRKHLESLTEPAAVLCFHVEDVPPPHVAVQMSADAAEYAAQMYEALRHADGLRLSRIVIELPPRDHDGPWLAVHDRLRRATSI